MWLQKTAGNIVIGADTFVRNKKGGRILLRCLQCIAIFLGGFLLINALFPVHADVEYSQIVTAADGTVMTAFLTSDDKWRMMTELDEITPEMQKAIIFKEDKYFYMHPGVNPAAVVRAAFNNIAEGKRTSGASTITMQVARLLHPKSRTLPNKCLEMFRALQLDMLYSKREILQLYLNLVPYGGNIEGVKAAAVLYMDKNPALLSLAELTALSIIPNRPTSLRPGIHNDIIVRERNTWLNRFKDAGIFDAEVIADALEEPLIAKRLEVPSMARHFSIRMKNTYTGAPIIKTTLQPAIQQQCEQAVQAYVKQLQYLNIHNAAVFAIDNKTHAVVAYVGSGDFFNTTDGGQVDGVKAVRSPGSTLKPVLYAMAFDHGLCTPLSSIADVPLNISGYSPGNYDETFHGNVSITYALANSLNVTAIRVLHQLGLEQLLNTLENAQFTSIRKQRAELGLSVMLGGCGVTLEELTGLYAGFANAGKMPHIRYLQNDQDTSAVRIISEESAFLVTEILSQLTRPDLPAYYHNAKKIPHIAWKTGTSYGRKDAWSIGYNTEYTIGVWAGNFSGRGVPELSGAQIATPLLFNIFHAIDHDAAQQWNKMPETVAFRYVCNVSGKIPATFCEHVVMDYYIPGVSKNDTCDHLIPVRVNPKETISYCLSCSPDQGYKSVLYQNLSPELIAWRMEQHLPVTRIPQHNPDCERYFQSGGPEITSPVAAMEYLLEKEDPQKIMLQANTASDIQKVFWYLNGTFLTSADPDEPVFILPSNGKNIVTCTDDKGRNSKVSFTITYI